VKRDGGYQVRQEKKKAFQKRGKTIPANFWGTESVKVKGPGSVVKEEYYGKGEGVNLLSDVTFGARLEEGKAE